MRSIGLIGSLAALAISAPLAAQSNRFRTDDVLSPGSTVQTQRGSRASKVPPGQLPPAGMCRIWIDGVPPGQQPAPTDCQTAVANKPANARILWGDQAAFPGKGKGKFRTSQNLQTGLNTTVQGNGRGRKNGDAENDNDDDDRSSARSTQQSVMNGGVANNISRGESLKSKKGKGHGDD